MTYAYDPNGNLVTKSDYSQNGGYLYGVVGKSAGGNAGPHAVRQVQRNAEGGNGTVDFSYDDNGNLIAITDAALPFASLYDHRNLPTLIQRGAATSRLHYGADDQRSRQISTADGYHVYLSNYEDVIASGGSAPVETRAYLGDYAVITRSASGRTVEYLLTDRLGSVDAVANISGGIIEKRGYDAFGAPRNGATWANLTPKRLQSHQRITTPDPLRARLAHLIDPQHPLAVLATVAVGAAGGRDGAGTGWTAGGVEGLQGAALQN